ncbi:SAM-dependent methyltransferase [Nocardia wallacei]|uniref:SAM-dependent methyltransferase n=1 Tax=Nocardia wallacei TaxID=480035 RepID=UPI0024554303|nr:SAM-dependent methyltransferase [Nocardia wallacei]
MCSSGSTSRPVSHRRSAPTGLDLTTPSSARVYDYLLGGKDNYEVDRVVAQRMLELAPDMRTLARFSRRFLIGATRIAAEEGVRQFVDIGVGLPTTPSVHEEARRSDPSARVALVDYDPTVYAHTNAMLDNRGSGISLLADFRDPDNLIHLLRAEAHFDLRQPIALLMVGVLHHVLDEEHPQEILARFHEVMAPGSFVAFTHQSRDSAEDLKEYTAAATDGGPAESTYRTASEVEAFFRGFELVRPGVVPIQEWLGDDLPATRLVLLGGMGWKPVRARQ